MYQLHQEEIALFTMSPLLSRLDLWLDFQACDFILFVVPFLAADACSDSDDDLENFQH